jgi:hypothetical protein
MTEPTTCAYCKHEYEQWIGNVPVCQKHFDEEWKKQAKKPEAKEDTLKLGISDPAWNGKTNEEHDASKKGKKAQKMLNDESQEMLKQKK